MIKTIIIDNESYIRELIHEKLIEYYKYEIEIVAEAASVEEGLSKMKEYDIDLIFLDIQLDDGTGFDLLERSIKKNFDVIFVTGFDQHAIKAIKVGALDYILKPIDENEFQLSVQKAIDSYKKDKNLEKLFEISSEYFRGVEKKRIVLKTSDTVYAVYEDDIIYCQSEGNYTTFFTQQMEKIVVSKPLKQIETILSENDFIRCHQSYIVNKKHVLKYNKQGVLIVNLNFKVPVSSRRKEYTLKKIFA